MNTRSKYNHPLVVDDDDDDDDDDDEDDDDDDGGGSGGDGGGDYDAQLLPMHENCGKMTKTWSVSKLPKQ